MKPRLTLRSITHRIIPAFALTLSSLMTIATATQAQTVITISPATPIVIVDGTSGGDARDTNCLSFIADKPNHTIEMTEDSDRRFQIKGNSSSTLLILNSQNKRFCVQADEFSGGEAELPGRWKKGTYRVYVGNKSQSNYRLTILPIN